MRRPVYLGEGTPVGAGVGAVTPPLPAPAGGLRANDILICYMESQAGQPISIANQAGGTWTLLTEVDSGGGAAGTRLTIYWSRYNGTQTAPTTSDSGDHNFAYIEAYRYCPITGTPYEGLVTGTDAAANTALSVAGSSTLGPDRLVIVVAARDNDNFNAHYSDWANPDLANIVERSDRGLTNGNGGGLVTVTAEKTAAGPYGATTATVAAAVVDAFATFALIGADDVWTDDFERAALGGNWINVGGAPGIIGSSDWGISGGNAAISAWWPVQNLNDQFSEAQIASGFNPQTSAAVFVRKQAGIAERYQFHYDTNGTAEIADPHWQLKHDGIDPGVVFATALTPGAPVAGDVLRIEARGQRISGFLNGVKIIEATHTALSSGAVGIAAAVGTGLPDPVTESVHESWKGGELFGERSWPFSRSDAAHRRSRW